MTAAAVRAELEAVVASALGELLGVADESAVVVAPDQQLDAVSVAGFELDSLDLLTVVLSVEAHFGYEIEIEPDVPRDYTWGDFLSDIERRISG